MFERFYRADRGPNRQIGSGLGLAIVAELASAMGGSVRAESPLTYDGGSRFVVTLPVWTAPLPVACIAGQRWTVDQWISGPSSDTTGPAVDGVTG